MYIGNSSAGDQKKEGREKKVARANELTGHVIIMNVAVMGEYGIYEHVCKC